MFAPIIAYVDEVRQCQGNLKRSPVPDKIAEQRDETEPTCKRQLKHTTCHYAFVKGELFGCYKEETNTTKLKLNTTTSRKKPA